MLDLNKQINQSKKPGHRMSNTHHRSISKINRGGFNMYNNSNTLITPSTNTLELYYEGDPGSNANTYITL